MAQDKISAMTAAVAADVAGSAGRLELCKAYATAPVTLGLDFQVLRTSMFAGSTGYTATDPLVCGAITSSGNLAIATTKFTVAAATGNTVVAGTLGVTGAATLSSTLAVTGTSTLTGNVGIGGAAAAYAGLRVISTAITGGNQWGVDSQPTFQSSATTSGRAVMAKVVTAAVSYTMVSGYGVSVTVPTIGAASAITTLYGVHVDNQGAANITNAYGVYIAAQSGASTVNMALYNAGKSQLMGAVGIGKAPTATSPLCATGIPTSAAGLASGDFWLNTNVLTIVP